MPKDQHCAHVDLSQEELGRLMGLDARELLAEPPAHEDLAEAGIEDKGAPAEGENASGKLPF
jgi:hypothetical protein